MVCTRYTISFHLCNTCPRSALLTTSYRWGNWGSETLRFAQGRTANKCRARIWELFFSPASDIELPFIIRIIIPWVICYVNVHWQLGYISLPWYWWWHGALGDTEPWPTSQIDQEQCQRQDPGPRVRVAHGWEILWVSQHLPSVTHPPEPFSHRESLPETCLGWLSPWCAGGAESDGCKSQLHHLAAL